MSNQNNYSMSNQMFISTKNACVIKRFKDQVNLSEPLYRDLPVQFNSICGSPKHRDIYDYKFSFLETAYIVYLYLKNNWNSNFTKPSTAETKIYLPLLRQKMHKPGGLLVLGFLQTRHRFYWPRAPDHRLISKIEFWI